MALNHWKDRLVIKNGDKTLSSKDLKIENDLNKYSEYALKYLDPNYTYDV